MEELNSLKIRIFDLSEQVVKMQEAINGVAQVSGFAGGQVADLIAHVEKLKGDSDELRSKNVVGEAVDGDSDQRSGSRRVGRPSKKD